MTGDAPFRLGLVGGGRMGQTHLRAFAESASVSVVAAADPVPATRAALGSPGRAVYATVAEMLDAGGIDGVLICAPTDRHAELVALVAERDLPILCEKPCGLTSREVAEAGAAAADHNVPLQIAYWRRYVPALQALKRRIDDGELGVVHLLVSSQWDGAPPSAAYLARSGGIFVDMGVHEFDQVRWLTDQGFGAIQAVSAPPIQVGPDAEDVESAQALSSLSGGISAFVSLGRYYPGGDLCRIEVFGTKDSVRDDFLDPKDGERVQLGALLRQAEGFAAFARGGPCTGATVQDAAAALDAAERAAAAIAASHARIGAGVGG